MAVRVVISMLLAALASAQIDKPPDFGDKPAFRQSAAGSLDSTSHIAGRSEAIAARLVRQLESFAPTGSGSPEHQLFNSAWQLVRQRHRAAAAAAFDDGTRRHPESESLAAGKVILLYLTGHYDESSAALLPLVRRFPGDPRLVVLVGETAGASPALTARFERALRAFIRTLPGNGGARYYLAQLLAGNHAKTPAEAVTLWQEAARLDPADPRPCLELARAANSSGRSSDAIAWLNSALQRDPSLPDAHYRLSRLYAKQGDRTQAANHLAEYRKLEAGRAAPHAP
ncbi:MAG: tetratricopeptide repeat protein [Bryobacteraceae bacterium]